MEYLIYVQFLVVLFAIFIGARVGGIGLGILVFGFGLKIGKPPVDVMLMIVAVITAAAALQGAGGLDYLVKIAEKILRRNPAMITIVAPIVCYIFTLFSGTGHIAYSLLPIISEIAIESKIRPERSLSISVIASQQAITASPISAATSALLTAELLGGKGIELSDILIIAIPATLLGVIVGAIVMSFVGIDLEKDSRYQEFLKKQQDKKITAEVSTSEINSGAKTAVVLFLLGVLGIVVFGSVPSLRPSFVQEDGSVSVLGMAEVIEIIMMSVGGLILVFSKTDVTKVVKGSVFLAGMQAVIAIFGIAWLGDTFFQGNIDFFKTNIEHIVKEYPFLFAGALFIMSIFLFSQAATVRTLYPLGISLGIPPMMLVMMFPAVNGYFVIPNYPTLVAAINFDRTGTTRIGKYVLNHSFQIPGFVATIVALAVGYLLISIL